MLVMKYVNFKRIAAKNFLSIGEEAVTVNFSEGLHVITGNNKDKPDRRNGVGKSCVAEIVYFAIFGETLRGIKKDLIPNNVTGGRTQVELDFEVITAKSVVQYNVIRHLSPTKVQLFEDGVDITLDSINNTTKHICNIISASPAVFENCVIMTVNNAVPFMAKNKIDKRKFIEDIFGLEVFSEMISKLRSEYNDIKKECDTQQSRLQEVHNTYDSYLQQRDQTLSRKKEKIDLYTERRQNNQNEIKLIQDNISNIEVLDVDSIKNTIVEYEKGIEKCDNFISTINADIAVCKQQINNLQEVYRKIGTSEQKCEVCLRSIEEHDLNHIQEEKNKLKEEIMKLGADAKVKAASLVDYTNKKQLIKNKISSLNKKVNDYNLVLLDKQNKEKRIEQLKEWLIDLDGDLAECAESDTSFDKLINDTQERIDSITAECNNYTKTLSRLDIVKYVVSEEGVKSYIVNKLLAILNNRLLHYLKKLDSNCICIFNEYFEEEILNEKNKVCSYFNFSGAERKAIDLACLFTFSDLRRLQGGVRYNVAIYDELFDSSFDEKGIELITNILKERVVELNECNIIISHRKESIKSVTGDIIYLEKHNGVTRRLDYMEI